MTDEELINESNGELVELDGYLGMQRALEGEIGRCDHRLSALKSDTKITKERREKAVEDLRGLVREYRRVLGRGARRRPPRRKARG